MQTSEMMVSVYCLAYNHEKYIRDALEGFVCQKTDFPFEVIVHDDASTDGTADIIREYAEKYPQLIKPILQTENQYSKGIGITRTYIMPRITGKYVAICEGDDYWCDENKLQKQVDFLEAHPDYSACVHNTLKLNVKTGKETVMYGQNEQDLTAETMILKPSGVCHTSSFFFRREYMFDRPAFVSAVKGVGDYPVAIHLAMEGNVHYFPQVMSVYRVSVEGSWTKRMHANREIYVRTQEQFIQMLEMADEYSHGRYHEAVAFEISSRQYSILKIKGENKAAIRHPHFKNVSSEEKLRMYGKVCFPWLLDLKRKWKH